MQRFVLWLTVLPMDVLMKLHLLLQLLLPQWTCSATSLGCLDLESQATITSGWLVETKSSFRRSLVRIPFAALEYQDPAMHASTFVERQHAKRISFMAAYHERITIHFFHQKSSASSNPIITYFYRVSKCRNTESSMQNILQKMSLFSLCR